jgi:DNA replication protein DnaC
MLTQELEIGVRKLNLQDVMRQYALQKRTCDRSASLPRDRVDWGEAVDVSEFCGRQAQLAMLEQWVMQDCCRLIAIAGIVGIGKTMLVTQLAQQLADTKQFEVSASVDLASIYSEAEGKLAKLSFSQQS